MKRTLLAAAVLLAGCTATVPNNANVMPIPDNLLKQASALIEQNRPDAALELLMPYAEGGDDNAQLDVGYIYETRYKDIPTAIKWYKKSAGQGNKIARFNLGNIYYNIHDYDKSFDYYQDSAGQGYAPAINRLGVHYFYGNGVERNYREAVKYFQEAYTAGDSYAPYYLALCYLDSLGVAQDLAKAESLLQEAERYGVEAAGQKLTELGWR